MEITEYDVLMRDPHSMNVGQLMNVIRAIRERLYQKDLELQRSKSCECHHIACPNRG